ncbi:MAG: hypothetical protein ACOYT4_02390 [Nanoarchaeota archaeon]
MLTISLYNLIAEKILKERRRQVMLEQLCQTNLIKNYTIEDLCEKRKRIIERVSLEPISLNLNSKPVKITYISDHNILHIEINLTGRTICIADEFKDDRLIWESVPYNSPIEYPDILTKIYEKLK